MTRKSFLSYQAVCVHALHKHIYVCARAKPIVKTILAFARAEYCFKKFVLFALVIVYCSANSHICLEYQKKLHESYIYIYNIIIYTLF